jgi:hypothetical protein
VVSTPIASSGVSTMLSSESSPQDFQQQMMSMLNTTFAKLTTVLSDSKSTDAKSDWPKFAGDIKKFNSRAGT